jgi:serine O-acetyltransferase
MTALPSEILMSALWRTIHAEVEVLARGEPVLASFFHTTVLRHQSLCHAVGFQLASQLGNAVLPSMLIQEVCQSAICDDANIITAIEQDIRAVKSRDPACDYHATPLLYFKGFQALQAWRIAHWLWCQKRYSLALYFQHQIALVFDVDIHPGATLGHGIMIDHATGVVIGETAVVGNDVSMLHGVTLGGSGCAEGRRHPTIGNGVLIATGASILGPIDIGDGAKIAAGSVVLESVAAHTTVAGVPARVVGRPHTEAPALDMNQLLKITDDSQN